MDYLHVPYHVMHFSERVNLKPYQLNSDIDQQIAERASQKLQGKCTQYGFVRAGSVIVISRTMGYQKSCHFNGELTFDIEVVADVCRPMRGDNVYCEVLNINRMGLLAKAGDQKELHIYIVKQHHTNAIFFEDERLKESCHILIEVVGSKSKLNDDKIIVIGKIKKIYDENALIDFTNKTVTITAGGKDDAVAFELNVNNHPAEQKASFGYQTYISNIKNLLGKVQNDTKKEISEEVLLHFNRDETTISGVLDDMIDNAKADDISSKRWARACNISRSVANEFELVHPPQSYDKNGIQRPYKPISRAFYKLWEIIKDFSLLSENNDEPMVFLHLAESPGSFVEACIKFREKISTQLRDKIFVMSLNSPTDTAPDTPEANRLDNLKNQYPNIYTISGGDDSSHIPSGYKSRQGDGTGDLFNLGNILDLTADISHVGGADFITSDLGFGFDDVENHREQCMHFPIFAQMMAILSCQKPTGSCVLKIFDIYTKVTVKLIIMFSKYYEQTSLTKPFTSRTGNSEKYLIARNYKGISKDSLRELHRVFRQWQSIETGIGALYNTNQSFVTDINNAKIPLDVSESILVFNTTHACQRQMRTLSNTIYVLKNYDHIDDYLNKAKERQAISARSWFLRYMDAK